MKSIFYLLFLIVSISGFSQVQPPNGNFEDWTELINGAENPTGWGSSNFAVDFGVPQSIFQTTDAMFGDYAIRIVTPSVGDIIYTTQAELNEQPFDDGGLPYTDSPTQMAAFIKGTIYEGDTAFVKAWLTHWDETNSESILIAEAFIGLSEIDTNYTLQISEFTYFSNVQPDTLFLVVGFGDHDVETLNADNEFFVDNIVFTGDNTVFIEETDNLTTSKDLLFITDILGRRTSQNSNGILIYYYSDGTVEKKQTFKK